MIKTEILNGITIISLNEISRLNALVAQSIQEQAAAYYDKPQTNLVLSLKDIRFIDSSGFGMLLYLMKRAKTSYGSFKICDVSPEVLDLMKLLQLHTIFEIFPTMNDCMKSFPSD